MKKTRSYNYLVLLALLSQPCSNAAAQTPAPIEKPAVNTSNSVDPNDIEVINNMDMLQNWDIVGPQGPDLNKGAKK